MRERLRRGEALRRSMSNIARYAGSIVKGDLVVVAVRNETYANRVQRLLDSNDPSWIDDARIVDTALHKAPLGIGEEASFEDHYGIDEGTPPWDARTAAQPANQQS